MTDISKDRLKYLRLLVNNYDYLKWLANNRSVRSSSIIFPCKSNWRIVESMASDSEKLNDIIQCVESASGTDIRFYRNLDALLRNKYI